MTSSSSKSHEEQWIELADELLASFDVPHKYSTTAMMSYQRLVEDVFGEPTEVITELELTAMLPRLLKNNNPTWSGDKLARLLVLRYGLAGERPHTFREIGEIHGRSQDRMRQLVIKVLRLLRCPSIPRKMSRYEHIKWQEHYESQARIQASRQPEQRAPEFIEWWPPDEGD